MSAQTCDRSMAARRAAATRALQRQCPTCPARPGERHTPNCYGGSINYSDDRNRYVPPPTRRLLAWRDCGPAPEACEGPRANTSASGESYS